MLWSIYVVLAVVATELWEALIVGEGGGSLYSTVVMYSTLPLALGLLAWLYLLRAALKRRELGWLALLLLFSPVAMPLYGRHRRWEKPL